MMILKTEGIIINSFPFQEHAQIIKVFTKNYGIISILQRRNNNFSHSLSEPLSKYKFFLQKGKSFYYIKDYDLLENFYPLKTTIHKNAHAILITDFIKNILYEEIVLEKVYDLYNKTLIFLEKSEKTLDITNGFLIKFITLMGFQPNIQFDAKKKNYHSFSIEAGGLIDPTIEPQHIDLLLSSEELNYLNYLLYNPLEKIDEITVNQEIGYKILDLLIEFLLSTFGIYKFKSIEFIRYLRK